MSLYNRFLLFLLTDAEAKRGLRVLRLEADVAPSCNVTL